MRLGDIVVAPGKKSAVSINLAQYIGSDIVSGTPTWTGTHGLTVSGLVFASNIATAFATPSQEGCDYNMVCSVTLSSGATAEFLVVIKCRTGDEDPRLTR